MGQQMFLRGDTMISMLKNARVAALTFIAAGLMLAVAALLPFGAFAFGGSESASSAPAAKGDKVVNIYSQRHYEVDKKIYEMFTARTGIAVNIISGTSGELIARAKSEGANTQADMFFVVGADTLAQLKGNGSLQPMNASLLKNVPAFSRDKDRTWTGVSKRARVIVYDKTKNPKPTVTSYEDLVTSGARIAVRSSENSYNRMLLASIIYNDGENGARTWVKNLVKSLARPPQGNDRVQGKAVVEGLADYAIMNTYYLGLMQRSTDASERDAAKKLGIIFPNQDSRGAHVNVAGVGVSAYAKNKDNAEALIAFLLSKEVQTMFTQENYEYPIDPSVPTNPVVAAWGKFKEDQGDLNAMGLLVPAASKLADQEGWK